MLKTTYCQSMQGGHFWVCKSVASAALGTFTTMHGNKWQTY